MDTSLILFISSLTDITIPAYHFVITMFLFAVIPSAVTDDCRSVTSTIAVVSSFLAGNCFTAATNLSDHESLF